MLSQVGKTHNRALLMKINKDKLCVEIDEEVPDITLDDLQEYLPESVPRFILYEYEYTHTDGRTSYPLVFIYYSPRELKPELAMLYSSTKGQVVNGASVMKIFDIQVAEDMTMDWINEKMKFFGS